jgi:UDP-N-acetylmuramoyl-L-alanyl-D-glutamate--2,6-diaminopimelate ligase
MAIPAVGQHFTVRSLLANWVDSAHLPESRIGGLALDSRDVRPGDLFFAQKGHRCHGMAYAGDACARGASAIVYDPSGGGESLAQQSRVRIPCIAIEALDERIGPMADKFFRHPSTAFDVIGVTGTNGKTSCSHFIAQALSDDSPCGIIGTLGWGIPGAWTASERTTPDAISVHAALARCRELAVKAVAMEVSSHGLVQERVKGVRFRGALYTNITRDHLDYHGSMNAYIEAKLRLLQSPGMEFVAVNLDDSNAARILAAAPASLRTIGFACDTTRSDPSPEVLAYDIRHQHDGLRFHVRHGDETAVMTAPLLGDFNVDNLLGALAVLLALGFRLEEAVQRLRRVRAVPGRMERFTVEPDGPVIVVDYAHTPDALANALRSLRRHCRAKLWTVFGCGGDRDRGKRPLMGRIAEQWADRIVITDDNPRGENGDGIVQDILAGCHGENVVVMRDRRAAIEWAVQRAEAADIVLIAGKGHESAQEIQGVKYPFSDRDVVTDALKGRAIHGSAPCASAI